MFGFDTLCSVKTNLIVLRSLWKIAATEDWKYRKRINLVFTEIHILNQLRSPFFWKFVWKYQECWLTRGKVDSPVARYDSANHIQWFFINFSLLFINWIFCSYKFRLLSRFILSSYPFTLSVCHFWAFFSESDM